MKRTRFSKLQVFIILCAVISMAAWWDFGTPKRQKAEEPAKTQELKEEETVVPSEPQIPAEGEEAPEAAQPPTAERLEEMGEEAPEAAELPTAERLGEMEEIGKELQDVIERTSRLQTEAGEERTEVYEIIERARLHERILKSITIPEPVKTVKPPVDLSHLLIQEKLKLIGNQTRQAQDQLRAIERARTIARSARPVRAPTPVKIETS